MDGRADDVPDLPRDGFDERDAAVLVQRGQLAGERGRQAEDAMGEDRAEAGVVAADGQRDERGVLVQ
ncbi:hypothetical protein [Nonomuraea sp. NPDC023979]|uniref:hypothetical protein n=1 Tax=Nonomuraea sp. NPDC023979 TaxID=3154796 RepID=UPI0033F83980